MDQNPPLSNLTKNNEDLAQSYGRIFDLIPVPIVVEQFKGNQSSFIYLNKAFTASLGFTLEDIPTANDWMHKAYPNDEYREVVKNWWTEHSQLSVSDNTTNGAKQAHFKTMITSKFGEERWFETRASIHTNHFNVITFIDIDEIKKQKNRLQRLNVLKDRMITLVSHDFRAPLASLKGLITLLANEKLSPAEMKSLVNSVGKQIGHSFHLLEDLLHWAKTKVDEQHIPHTRFNILELIEECIGLFTPSSTQKKIAIRVLNSDDIFINHDKELLKIVIRNLLSNAIKYTPTNGMITITYLQKDTSVFITVKDNGIGMTPNQIESILNYKHLNTTLGTEKEKGSGLGLTLTNEALLQANGKLYVTAEPEKGSEFTIEWPILAIHNKQLA